jgi:hypothetical protein
LVVSQPINSQLAFWCEKRVQCHQGVVEQDFKVLQLKEKADEAWLHSKQHDHIEQLHCFKDEHELWQH